MYKLFYNFYSSQKIKVLLSIKTSRVKLYFSILFNFLIFLFSKTHTVKLFFYFTQNLQTYFTHEFNLYVGHNLW